MKRILSFILVLCCTCSFLMAVTPLSELFPNASEDWLTELKNGQTYEAVSCYSQSITSLAPVGSQGSELAALYEKPTKGFSIASVSFVPFPEKYQQMTDEQRRVDLYNVIRSISTQEGLTYISHSAGDKRVVLFEESYIVSKPDVKGARVPDPNSTTVPESYSCYSYQKDNRFGKNIYSVNYTLANSDYLMDISNYTTMKYMGISCVKAGDLHMYLDICMAEEGFVVYSMAVVNRDPEVKILFLTVDLPSAFMRRTTALKEWFEMRIEK